MLTTSYVQIKHSSKFRVISFVVLSWLLPALTWTPSIIGYRYLKHEHAVINTNACEVRADKYLVLVMSIALYHIPLICMVAFYTKLIIHIRKSSDSICTLDQIKTDYLKYYNSNRNHQPIINSNNNNPQQSIKSNKTSHKSQNNNTNQELSKNSNPNESFKYKTSFYKKEQTSLIDNPNNNFQVKNNDNLQQKQRFGSTRTLKTHDNSKGISRIVPFLFESTKRKQARSNSLNNSNLAINRTMSNEKAKFRSNVIIRLLSDKSSEKKSQRFKQSVPQSNQNSKIDDHENNYFVGLMSVQETPALVRFQAFKSTGSNANEANNKEETRNKTNGQEIALNSKNLVSKLKSSMHKTNSKSEMNRSSFLNDFYDYRQVRLKRNRKAARMLGLLVTAFLVCWLPYIILFPLSHFLDEDTIPNYATFIIWWLGYLNSTINPFLYVYSNKNIRSEF